MDEGAILVTGVGGIGCTWAEKAHTKCSELADLLLIDADESSFAGAAAAHCLHLDLQYTFIVLYGLPPF